MNGIIIVFRLPPRTNNTDISKFCQQFYGQNSSSHKGKYSYRRRGLLDNIVHKKLIRGVLIILEKDLDIIFKFLEAYNAEVHVRTIELTADDQNVLLKGIS